MPLRLPVLEFCMCQLFTFWRRAANGLTTNRSGPISDADEAAALNYGYHNTSIYSCSWGPSDDGRSMEGPSYLIQKAVVNGIQNGRGGKGSGILFGMPVFLPELIILTRNYHSVFVFASGNGAAQGDQCNFDGYTNSIYSVTVAAIDYKGLHPYYSESCAAVSANYPGMPIIFMPITR